MTHCQVSTSGPLIRGYMFPFRNGMTDHTHSPSVFFHAMGLGDFNGLSNGWKMRTASTIKTELGHSEVKNIFSTF